jgi:hypothetical protein
MYIALDLGLAIGKPSLLHLVSLSLSNDDPDMQVVNHTIKLMHTPAMARYWNVA